MTGIDEVDSPTLRLGPHERVTIVRESPDLLELEAEYDPGGTPPPSHYHPAQDERFEVLAGAVRCRTPDGEHELRAGETVELSRARSPLGKLVAVLRHRQEFRLARLKT